MLFEERLVFVFVFIVIVFFALILIFDNAHLMLKNARLRKENKKLIRKISVYEKQEAKEQERLRPYFDDAKGRVVNPRAEERKRKDALAGIATAMSMLSPKNKKK